MERRARRVAGGQVLVVDLQRPRQVGGPAEQLLVEPVPPPPDGLGEGDARRRARRRVGGADAVTAGDPDPDRDADDQPARDPEAALPDLRDVAEVVVESAASR